MALYMLTNKEPQYDEFEKFIVIADSEDQARKLCKENASKIACSFTCVDPDIWINENCSDCIEITDLFTPRVLIGEYSNS